MGAENRSQRLFGTYTGMKIDFQSSQKPLLGDRNSLELSNIDGCIALVAKIIGLYI